MQSLLTCHFSDKAKQLSLTMRSLPKRSDSKVRNLGDTVMANRKPRRMQSRAPTRTATAQKNRRIGALLKCVTLFDERLPDICGEAEALQFEAVQLGLRDLAAQLAVVANVGANVDLECERHA